MSVLRSLRTAARRTCLAALLPLCAGAHADTAPPVSRHKSIEIDKLAPPVRSRILIGNSGEGTSVEATKRDGGYDRIVSEELDENGYTISDFRFDHGSPIRAHIVRAGYKGYPDTIRAGAPRHQHLVVDPTDIVISDQTYDLTPNAALCTTPDCTSARQDARTQAELYLRFMNTPTRPGTADDDHYWDCVPAAEAGCPSFKQEGQ